MSEERHPIEALIEDAKALKPLLDERHGKAYSVGEKFCAAQDIHDFDVTITRAEKFWRKYQDDYRIVRRVVERKEVGG
jgi:hypothetical protein